MSHKFKKTKTSGEYYTNNGEVRKRKRFQQSVAERKKRKLEERIMKYTIKPSCKTTCKKKCTFSFIIDQQEVINNQYWQMTFTERRNFILSAIISNDVKRHRVLENSKRNRIQVCKTFFLQPWDIQKITIV